MASTLAERLKKMTLEALLNDLTDAERNFIARLDYGHEAERHREELDLVIKNQGVVEMARQVWHPYEVIELGRYHLQDGHEREFVACIGIVLKNMILGTDKMNYIDSVFDSFAEYEQKLSDEHRDMVWRLVDEAKETC